MPRAAPPSRHSWDLKGWVTDREADVDAQPPIVQVALDTFAKIGAPRAGEMKKVLDMEFSHARISDSNRLLPTKAVFFFQGRAAKDEGVRHAEAHWQHYSREGCGLGRG